MKFRVVLLNEKHEHIFDEIVDSRDYEISGESFALKPKDPFLCGGVIIDPNPKITKVS